MFSRYKRLVPRAHRDLIASQGLAKPNWFVGAAEQPLDPRDSALEQQIAAVEKRIDERHRREKAGGQSAVTPTPAPVDRHDADRGAPAPRMEP
jgi:hypothetical protein